MVEPASSECFDSEPRLPARLCAQHDKGVEIAEHRSHRATTESQRLKPQRTRRRNFLPLIFTDDTDNPKKPLPRIHAETRGSEANF